MIVKLPFMLPVRVYWEDTDAGGVVYHANYVCFFERARSEWLRESGLSQGSLKDQQDLVFAVRAMKIDFLKPARLDDLLEVTIERIELRPASLVFQQRIVRAADGLLLGRAEVRCACLSAGEFQPRALPPAIAEQLRAASVTE
jgi:acyl-CoA thioester hydrolase